jgi:RNA polymerase sigma factor FliA
MDGAKITALLPGVRRMANRMPLARNGAMDKDDMEQDAALGVVHAARSFDPGRGTRFATLAYLRARGAVLDGQRALDHVPRSWRAAQRRVLQARTALIEELTRAPTAEELAERMEISTQELRDIEERCRPAASLAEPLPGQAAEGENLSLTDLVVDAEPLPDEVVVAREDAARLHAAIAQLPGPHQFAVRATWFMGMTSCEAAEVLGLSASRMSQIRSDALDRLSELVAA